MDAALPTAYRDPSPGDWQSRRRMTADRRTGPPSAARTTRVLIVDDQAPLAHGLRRRIERDLGPSVALEIDVALSGAEALAALRGRRPHALIIDRFLGDADGVELIARLRAAPKWRDLSVLVITGGTVDEIAGRCCLLGAGVTRKEPAEVMIECVLQIVRAVVARPRSPAEEKRSTAASLAGDAKLSRAEHTVKRLSATQKRALVRKLRSMPLARRAGAVLPEADSKGVN